MEFLNVMTVEEARDKVLSVFSDLRTAAQTIDVLSAGGRVLRETVAADCDVPGFDRSTVDGYAVNSRYTFGSSDTLPSLLDYAGSVDMGETTALAVDGPQAVYVPTGGMLPSGADAVVMIEHSERYDESTVAVNKAVRPEENVTRRGDDMRRGQTVLSPGRIIDAWAVGALAAMGRTEVQVSAKPQAYIISTGDEIIEPGCAPAAGQIRDINGWALCALLQDEGCQVIGRRIVKDDYHQLREAVDEACHMADIVLMSGGSSVGAKDYTSDLLNSFGGLGVFVNGMAVKPGKPTIVARVKDRPVFGLPGHPVSAVTVWRILGLPLVRQMTGSTKTSRYVEAEAAANLHSAPGKETYQLMDLLSENGRLKATPIYGKSGLITTLVRAKGYIRIPANEEGIYEGQTVRVYTD